ncbi:MAG TPA: HlyD family type I secretion periplasmic adaptor subunit, partial [Candidatus Omnitrophota bacterium]|nr:HlyD family type I secretion periplasmic adaptor subunit [Candidatus Omnitrophota bacterium]
LAPTAAEAEAPPRDPASIAKPVRVGVLILAAFWGSLSLWSVSADVAGAVVAQGVVVPEGRRKTIQHLTGGIVREILVREGQSVAEGQPLIRLDEVQTQASVDVYRNQYASAKALEARLLAEQRGAADIPPVPELDGKEGRAALEQERKVFLTRKAAFDGEVGLLRERVSQLNQEIKGHENLKAANTRQLALIEQELEGLRDLFEKGFTPKTKVLQYERTQAGLRGDVGYRESEIARARQRISETRAEMTQLEKRRLDEVNRELRDVQTRIADVEPRLVAANQAMRQTTLAAPVAGWVLNLSANTVGGVVEPGKPIMDLVPEDSPIIVQAQIQPTDIDAVAVGQAAKIHLLNKGLGSEDPLDGTVTVVSADRLVEQRAGVPYYQAEVEIDRASLSRPGVPKIIPGFPVQVIIPTTPRTLFAYLMDPLTQRFRTALRER